MKRYVSIIEACDRWSIGKTRLYELLKNGELKAVKLGRRTLVDVGHGDLWFASLPRL